MGHWACRIFDKAYTIFCCHSGPYFDQNHVNEAIAGRRRDPDQMVEGHGGHIPEKHYVTVFVQTRPTDSTLRPYFRNLGDNNELRQHNAELAKGKKGSYVNPIGIIAVSRRVRSPKRTDTSGWRIKKRDTFDPRNSRNADLLLFQERGENPMDMDDLLRFVSDYCKRKHGNRDSYEPEELRWMKDIPVRFVSTEKSVEFLRDSQLYNAIDLKIRDGRLFTEDFERLETFQIV